MSSSHDYKAERRRKMQEIYQTLALLSHRELCELLAKVLWTINNEGDSDE